MILAYKVGLCKCDERSTDESEDERYLDVMKPMEDFKALVKECKG